MTAAEVERVVAHARALIEAHERRFPGYPFATEAERTQVVALSFTCDDVLTADRARDEAA